MQKVMEALGLRSRVEGLGFRVWVLVWGLLLQWYDAGCCRLHSSEVGVPVSDSTSWT